MSCYLSIGGYIEIFFERIMISYIPGGCCERPAGLDSDDLLNCLSTKLGRCDLKNESLVIQSVRLMALMEKKDTSQYIAFGSLGHFSRKIKFAGDLSQKSKQNKLAILVSCRTN